ncbi:MAG: YceI family protein [Sediminibacterium sp.]|nr:YceI family protein [Sediminibacterium sp.]
MKHKLHKWEGVATEMNVTAKWNDRNEMNQIAVQVKISAFNSGMASRDRQMLEVTDAATHPTITFSSSEMDYTDKGIVVKGKLQFHGITRDMQTVVKMIKKNNRTEYTGSFPILLEDYTIKRPSLLFVKVDNQVDIRFRIVMTDK